MPTNNQPCRCDSGMEYADCCGPLHRGERPAATAVQRAAAVGVLHAGVAA
ncbi:SEC-C metal-binding domain-containing protein, partial [Mycolicibacterium sp. CBMA 361]|nr:hypothetical protein [Mycolicibacterium sp. CBMA 361]